MKITITGCNGQLGSELQKILRNGVSELGNIPETLMEQSWTVLISESSI